MMSALPCRVHLLLLGCVVLLYSALDAKADVVSAPTATLKRFTGILSGTGPTALSPGTELKKSKKIDWVDFICDPRLINWKIRVLDKNTGGKNGIGPTQYFDQPHVCGHVEIIMIYYNPEQSFPETGLVDGTALSIRGIP